MLKKGLRTLLYSGCILLIAGWTAGALAGVPMRGLQPGGVSDGGRAVDKTPESVVFPPEYLPDLEFDSEWSTDDGSGADPDRPPGAIVGRVFSGHNMEDCEPLPGTSIWLFRKGLEGLHFVRATHSGPLGYYAFAHVRPGRFLLVASAPEHLPTAVGVRVHPGQQKVRNLLLHPAGPPEFGVVVGHVFGVMPNGHQGPLPGAVVRLFNEDGIVAEAVTGEHGFYEMGDIPPGEYGISAEAEDFQPQEAPIMIEPGQVVERNFLLQPADPPDPGTIVGHVFGMIPDDEIPLAGALVRLMRPGQVICEAVTNEDGFYIMEEVPPGEYLIVAHAEGFYPFGMPIAVVPGEVIERNFFLHPVSEPEPGAIAGRVFAVEPNGTDWPLPGALVSLFRGGGLVREVATDEEGFYYMDDVPPGHYWIMAGAEGFEPAGGVIWVPSGEVIERDFHLMPLPVPHGACCLEDVCAMLPGEVCEEEGGEYMGDATPCFPNPCTE